MFQRTLIAELHRWVSGNDRKPLILHGARQVGKTTAVDLFGSEFAHYLRFNLDIVSDRALFENNDDPESLLAALLFSRGVPRNKPGTLIFIDEIQTSPKAVTQLRYFHELFPEYPVIAAGSLLESLIGRNISFPVGRVEYRMVHPVSFPEFLEALQERESIEMIQSIPFPEYAHDKLLGLFRIYTFIGGMPEIVGLYLESPDLTLLQPVYDSLITSYLDDVEKYAPNDKMRHVLRFLIRQAFYFAGSRIKFQGFGKSDYGSKEIGDAFRLLEKTFLLRLVYPSVETKPPAVPDIRKSPRLQLLDTGLVNFMAGLQGDLYGNKKLNEIYEGRIIEHVVGQELLAMQPGVLSGIRFWVRERRQSQSEVDYIYPYSGYLIPLEVKSGAAGHLRSLHQFIDASGRDFAIRVFPGKFSVEEHKTLAGNKFRLMNLPCYLISQVENYLKVYFK